MENDDLVNFYNDLARSIPPANMAGYISAYVNRTALNLVRPIGPNMPGEEQKHNQPTVIETDVFLVTGERAVEMSRAMADMNGQMDPKKTQFIVVNNNKIFVYKKTSLFEFDF